MGRKQKKAVQRGQGNSDDDAKPDRFGGRQLFDMNRSPSDPEYRADGRTESTANHDA